jgi:hypothetical protein
VTSKYSNNSVSKLLPVQLFSPHQEDGWEAVTGAWGTTASTATKNVNNVLPVQLILHKRSILEAITGACDNSRRSNNAYNIVPTQLLTTTEMSECGRQSQEPLTTGIIAIPATI